jgi:hypothetical protein
MSREMKRHGQKREAPTQFRAESELGELVGSFAIEHGLASNSACKALVGLAAAEMDRRFYTLVLQLASAMGGTSAFSRACSHIHTALTAARRATGSPLQAEPERPLFIFSTVAAYLAIRGLDVDRQGLWFLPADPHHGSALESAPRTKSPREMYEEDFPKPGEKVVRRRVSSTIAAQIARHHQKEQARAEGTEPESAAAPRQRQAQRN